MKNFLDNDFAVFWFFGTVVVLIVAVAAVIGVNNTETKELKLGSACVQAGGEWVRSNDRPFYMECRRK